MQFDNICLQSCRYNNTSLNIRELIRCRESCRIVYTVTDQSRQKLQDFVFCHRSCNHREYIVHDLEDLAKTGRFCLADDHLDHTSLSLCTSHIKACCITDTTVRSCLYTIQMIMILNCLDIIRSVRKFDWCIILTCFFGCLYTVVIHMNNLGIRHIHIQSTKVIDDRCQRIEVYGCIFADVQVEVCIQHCDRLFGFTVSIRCVRLGISIVTKIEKGISIYRNQLHIFCVIIYACNNNCITVLTAECSIFITVVNTKQSICCITCQS